MLFRKLRTPLQYTASRLAMTAPPPPSAAEVTQWLAENGDLIEAAHERLSLGRLHESLQYQLALQQNLIYLGTHADQDPALEPIHFLRQPQAGGAPIPVAGVVAEGDDDDDDNDDIQPAADASGGRDELETMIEETHQRNKRRRERDG